MFPISDIAALVCRELTIVDVFSLYRVNQATRAQIRPFTETTSTTNSIVSKNYTLHTIWVSLINLPSVIRTTIILNAKYCKFAHPLKFDGAEYSGPVSVDIAGRRCYMTLWIINNMVEYCISDTPRRGERYIILSPISRETLADFIKRYCGDCYWNFHRGNYVLDHRLISTVNLKFAHSPMSADQIVISLEMCEILTRWPTP